MKNKWAFIFIFIIPLCFSSCIKTTTGPQPKPPFVPFISSPYDLALDQSDNIYLNGEFDVLKLNTGGILTSIADTNGWYGYGGDGGLAISAALGGVWGICLDSIGNVYFTDISSHTVHEINVSNGIMTAVAGNGNNGNNGDGGQATSAELNSPQGIALDKKGNLYITDKIANRVRIVNLKTGIISAFAGTGVSGSIGDGGPAISCELNNPYSLSLDDSMNVYICDNGNNTIRKISVVTGIINTIAGNGQSSFNGDNISALSAAINPGFLVFDSAKNIYLTDITNNRIRRIDCKTNIITTIAGNGINGNSGDNGPAVSAELSFPYGLVLSKIGNIYFADCGNSRIRKIVISTDIISNVSYH